LIGQAVMNTLAGLYGVTVWATGLDVEPANLASPA